MPPPATPSADARHTNATAGWRMLGRHQVGAIVATLIDFSVMIFCVERLGMRPAVATGVGATLGGITNFTLGRTWVFPHSAGRLGGQALRYASVSAGGAALNAFGEHLVNGQAHVQYVVARAIVSLAVSLLWNYPMQREFVFQAGGRHEE